MSEDKPKYDVPGKKEIKPTPYQITVSEETEKKIQELVMSNHLGKISKRSIVLQAVEIGINIKYEELQEQIDKGMEE